MGKFGYSYPAGCSGPPEDGGPEECSCGNANADDEGEWVCAEAPGFCSTDCRDAYSLYVKQEAEAEAFELAEHARLVAALPRVTERGWVTTALGPALRIQIERTDGARMSFTEVWSVFEEHYPGKWALQAFPPSARFFDQANKYHLHVISGRPTGFDLFDDTQEEPL